MSVFSFSDLAFLAVAAGYTPTDTDAAAYITAVETADGQALEPGVRRAIDEFVIGCKADGIWNAIKASCILAGARTLAGALVPLVGAAPTPFYFLAEDYNRKTGLVGDGSTKYLNSNRNNNADPQNNNHNSAFITTGSTVVSHIIGSNSLNVVGANSIYTVVSGGVTSGCWSRGNGATSSTLGAANTSLVSFVGTSRNSSSSFDRRANSSTLSSDVTSSAPTADSVLVFARGTPASNYTNARLAFYSIGEALDLALLDARVTTLINAFAAAIP